MLATLLKASIKYEEIFGNNTITLNNPDPHNTGTDNYFGYAVAISDNYAVVSAPQESDNSGIGSGKVYVFNAANGTLIRTFDNPNPYGTSSNDFFGRSVSIYGDLVVVGAYNEDETGNLNSGKVYIFSISSGNLIFTLNNPNVYGTSANDCFGIRVAIHGNNLIAGAYQEDEASGTNSGRAYIFNAASGELLFILNNPNSYDTPKNDYFGWGVDIGENYSIVGAYQEDTSGGSNSGRAYIFDNTTGLLVSTLNNPNTYGTSKDDNFGWSVAISGNYAAVGAHNEDSVNGTNSGSVYVFDVITGTHLRTFNNPNPYSTSKDDYFGYHVSICGKYVIVGAYQEDEFLNSNSGKAYIFDITNGNLIKTLNNPNAYNLSASDYFGFNVSICGRRAIVGAYGEDDSSGTMSGKAYIFS